MEGTTAATEPPVPPPEYWERRAAISAQAAGIDAAPVDIEYLDEEHETWATVAGALHATWRDHAASAVSAAGDRLDLPLDRVPQLSEVDARLRPLTGFGYRAVPGIIAGAEFFGALGRSVFPSTQYLRWSGAPLYTPEPDVIHEVLGHANILACRPIAELHRLAGRAVERVETDAARQALGDVFWFSAEFGVVREGGAWRAYGAGLLSSPGELAWFADHAEVRPLDLHEMATTPYDIHRYQPVLFGASSLEQVLDVVGGFFDSVTDERVDVLRAA
jgi:phenylalanine-4-hydroxylase